MADKRALLRIVRGAERITKHWCLPTLFRGSVSVSLQEQGSEHCQRLLTLNSRHQANGTIMQNHQTAVQLFATSCENAEQLLRICTLLLGLFICFISTVFLTFCVTSV
ncbi:hypothetical protein XENOCAPTIV_007031 [Xenoophorus captivus]|uniref:Uncharacterized protein n=1 Tax=Xenoophorus captivus TaxID=1517983 RepID=A0ABV0Q4P1_9TELE